MIRVAAVALLVLPLAAHAEAPKTDDEKALYAIGYITATTRGIPNLQLKRNELKVVQDGFRDGATGAKPKIEVEQQQDAVNKFAQARLHSSADKEKNASKAFLDKSAQEKGAQKTPSGLIIKMMRPGNGPSPKETDRVKVNYEGRLINGTVFDSSYKRGQPAEFPLNGVIKCWTEGVQKMHVGEEAELICPSDIAYGDRGHPPTIPGGATLIFKVELLGINGQ